MYCIGKKEDAVEERVNMTALDTWLVEHKGWRKQSHPLARRHILIRILY
jgi:hypothetical protein